VDEKDLEVLFRSVGEAPDAYPESARRVFNILVRVTLDYRDHMLASQGRVVTVQDVRTALSWLIPALATGNIPRMDDPVCADLLQRWLSALKGSQKQADREDIN